MSNDPSPVRCALYTRVSTDDKGQDTENQLIQLRQYCALKGYIITKEYTENITGTGKKERPQFIQMLKEAKQRKFDLLLVWSYDRFSRGGLKDTHYIADLSHWGVKFFSYQEPFLDTTETGELLLGIFSWIAKQEAKKISDRTRAGLNRARQQGKRLGRLPIEFDMARAEQLRASGASLRVIAKELGCSHVLVKQRLAKRSVVSDTLKPSVQETDVSLTQEGAL